MSRRPTPVGRITVAGEPAEIAVSSARIVFWLWGATALVIALGVSRELFLALVGPDTALQDLRHFALDTEHSLPAWYSSLLMAAIATLLSVLALLSRRQDSENRLHWGVLAAVFLLLSMDESVSFHESTIEPLRAAFGLTGILHFGWVLIAAPLLVIAGLFFLPFVLRLPGWVMARFVIAGSIFVFGAFGMELVGGYWASALGMESLPYKLAAMSEECLEMVGLTVFAWSLVTLIVRRAPQLTVHLR